MFFFLIEWIAYLCYWFWPLWPIILICSLVNAIGYEVRQVIARELGREVPNKPNLALIPAILSLTVLFCGLLFPLL